MSPQFTRKGFPLARVNRASEGATRPTPLTRVEGDLADHDPARGEGELELDELADSVVQLDRDVARVLEDPVLHVGVDDRLAQEVLAADAERDVDL